MWKFVLALMAGSIFASPVLGQQLSYEVFPLPVNTFTTAQGYQTSKQTDFRNRAYESQKAAIEKRYNFLESGRATVATSSRLGGESGHWSGNIK
jgi:hypothetical protein